MADHDPVAGALAALGLPAQFRSFPEGTATAEQAAAAVGCELGQIVKSLIFVAEPGGELLLALVSGANRVDESLLAAAAGCASVRKATAREVEERTGFRIGVVPPVGHRAPLRAFLDRELMNYPVLWAASGVHDRVFPIAPVMLSAAARADIVVIKA
jgi:prolyl-tRNA editing enzyme YbaK/EbsC (Cys-tRNA(Pro) deacylase)